MAVRQETSAPTLVGLRMVLSVAGGLVLLLIVLAIVRPHMLMSALHHAEAMIGMDMGVTR